MQILILNGPNLNMLGLREPEIYGSESLEDVRDWLLSESEAELNWLQSNSEGDLIDAIQDAQNKGLDVIINPGAFTHYSYGLRDALASLTSSGSVAIEVHLSNPSARESFRQVSVISPAVTGTIAGFGKHSYLHAISEIRRRRGI
jgi:3-dehydroquinate dehydratase-2